MFWQPTPGTTRCCPIGWPAPATILGADGAGLSFVSNPERRLPLGSSDEASATAERIQFALGDGPCLTAQRTRTAIRANTLDLTARWPVYAQQLALLTPFRSVVALPVGGLWSTVVAMDLCSHHETFPPVDQAHLQTAAEFVGQRLTTASTGAGQLLGLPGRMHGTPVQRRQQVWLAVGRLSAHRGSDATDALALLRGYASRNDHDLEGAAHAILRGELPPA